MPGGDAAVSGSCWPDGSAARVVNAARINIPTRKRTVIYLWVAVFQRLGSPRGLQAKIVFDQTTALFDTNFRTQAVFGCVGHVIQQFLNRRRCHLRARVRGTV